MVAQGRERPQVGLAVVEADYGGRLGRNICSSAVSFRSKFHPRQLQWSKEASGPRGLERLEEENAELLDLKDAMLSIT